MKACTRGAVTVLATLSLPLISGCPILNCVSFGTSGEVTNLPIDDGLDGASFVAGSSLSSSTTDNFSGSGQCTGCHSNLTDAAGNDVSIGSHWRSTMMANAAVDPLFLAVVEDEIDHFPNLRGVIEETCATCHMPMARTQALADGTPVAMFGDGFLNTSHNLHGVARDGVSCTVCHQIQDVNLGESESFSGGYVIDSVTAKPDRVNYGPFTDPEQSAMRTAAQFTPVYGAHIEQSSLCATCHTLFTPTLDEAGNVVGTFPELMTFFEWQHSQYGPGRALARSCQQCHMPEAVGDVIISTFPPNLTPRSPFVRHFFVGGNTFMLKLLRGNIDELGLTASSDDFRDTIVRTFDMLRDNIGLNIVGADIIHGVLVVRVQVTSNAGHKFPTGFPSRRAWVHLKVTDDAGQTVFESGAPQADGSIAGNDADADASVFEPHYDFIDDPEQVQIYEPILRDTNGNPTYVLLRAAGYAKDNRLPPPGFDKATADENIAIHGLATADANFVGGSDEVSYWISLDTCAPSYTVTARLLFQSVSYRYVAQVRLTDGPQVRRYGEMHDAADKAPAVIEALQTTVRR